MWAADRVARIDRQEVFRCGLETVGMALSGKTGFMVSLPRHDDIHYSVDYQSIPSAAVAGKIRTRPVDFYNARGNFTTT